VEVPSLAATLVGTPGGLSAMKPLFWADRALAPALLLAVTP
jgi:hypothetical protein